MDENSPFSTTSSSLKHQFTHLTIPLDSIYSIYELPFPDYIKVDVDGNEAKFLSGARQTLSAAKEIYFEDSLTEDCSLFKKFLLTAGFNLFTEEPIYSKLDSTVVTGFNQLYSKLKTTS